MKKFLMHNSIFARDYSHAQSLQSVQQFSLSILLLGEKRQILDVANKGTAVPVTYFLHTHHISVTPAHTSCTYYHKNEFTHALNAFNKFTLRTTCDMHLHDSVCLANKNCWKYTSHLRWLCQLHQRDPSPVKSYCTKAPVKAEWEDVKQKTLKIANKSINLTRSRDSSHLLNEILLSFFHRFHHIFKNAPNTA